MTSDRIALPLSFVFCLLVCVLCQRGWLGLRCLFFATVGRLYRSSARGRASVAVSSCSWSVSLAYFQAKRRLYRARSWETDKSTRLSSLFMRKSVYPPPPLYWNSRLIQVARPDCVNLIWSTAAGTNARGNAGNF